MQKLSNTRYQVYSKWQNRFSKNLQNLQKHGNTAIKNLLRKKMSCKMSENEKIEKILENSQFYCIVFEIHFSSFYQFYRFGSLNNFRSDSADNMHQVRPSQFFEYILGEIGFSVPSDVHSSTELIIDARLFMSSNS